MRVVGTMKFDDRTEVIDAVLPTMYLWIVYKKYETGKVERVAAYFSEEGARKRASELVGKDGALIGLEMIPVNDHPLCAHEWEGYKHPEGGLARSCKKCGQTDRTW